MCMYVCIPLFVHERVCASECVGGRCVNMCTYVSANLI